MAEQADGGSGRADGKEQAYRRLRDWIIYSELRPGSAIKERELAERLGVSRTPLREILQRLHYVGLVDWQPNIGVFVAPIDYGRIREIFEVRLALERAAVSLATVKATAAQIDDLDALLGRCRQAIDTGEYVTFISLDALFHEKIRDIAGNAYLATLMDNAHNVALRFWYLYRESLADTYHDIENLGLVVEAMRRRDAPAAANAIAAHIVGFLRAFHAQEIDALCRAMAV
ncbi:GntR family transcriptional regulator [Rhodospirillum rubrum]|uniref:Transcriptional regulator, GntR family n=1 Tax=Rhodospirillum rubrum (strain ATCC 11170 / ATH 1.1.1 / DSM 467 / LMG 4362 / NCIMB 8255 / S1) TaxID=269796 RepID=Q2RMX0_RHORT|nr:GntR family transcriptional regulator [Rhodospirillum rubrum]ABC24525.1 transcriptional regulator, GntR family [Rhodospirillum rubrum ATCC 11170]AEO50277.1 GntR family transcriptional regulator [Rhodospirillum rubrum F11]MBK5956250.1 GntR family transcriptional regulator [Rhodospirillum rubrum]QXG80442.1 GntR family transcriptional regulator [Rhodospirillum rubrum]HAP99419.1 GntR family transcriptional regulator [Rhodospirillum rubrum]